MYSYIYKFILIVFFSTFFVNINAQTTLISDPLNGSTVGTIFGGSFSSEGYKPGVNAGGTSDNHIMYRLSQSPDIGYIEFEVKGFDYSKYPATTTADPNFSNTFVILYDGRGVTEPIKYFYDYRNNYFRWEIVYRGPHKTIPGNGNRFKAKMLIASPTLSNNLGSGQTARFSDSQLEDPKVIWKGEPDGITTAWDINTWYKIRVYWNNVDKVYQIFRNNGPGTGLVEVWNMNKNKGSSYTPEHNFPLPSKFPRTPKDFRFNLGAGPSSHDEYQNTMPNIVYRNLNVVALKESVTPPTNSLSIAPSSQNVSSASGSTTFNVTSNVSWSVSDNASWLTVSPTSDSDNGTINANFDANTSASSRTAVVTITGGGLTRTVSVIQSGTGSTTNALTVSPSTQSVGSGSGNTNFAVTSNVSWSVSDNASWLTVTPTSDGDNGTVTASFSSNTSSSSRTAIITISGGGITRTINVTQAGTASPPPSSDKLQITSPSAGQTLLPGSIHQINWNGPSSVANVTILFSSDGGRSWTIISSSTANDGNHSWTVPSVNSTNCLVRVKDIKDWNHYDRSDIFKISKDTSPPPSSDKLQVTSPSAGQTLVPGSIHQINWVGPSSVADVTILFSSDGGRSWKIISGSTANDGNQSWTVPNVNSSNCLVRVKDIKDWNHYDRSDIFKINGALSLTKEITSEETFESSLPTEFSLMQNYPNPFNPSTTISYSIPDAGFTRLLVYNSLGEVIQSLVNENQPAGRYNVNFNASNLPSGMYFYSISSGNFTQTNKMILMK